MHPPRAPHLPEPARRGWSKVSSTTRILRLLLPLFPLAAQSADWVAAEDAYNRADYKTALAQFRELAEHGDAASQHKLGLMRRYGRGVL